LLRDSRVGGFDVVGAPHDELFQRLDTIARHWFFFLRDVGRPARVAQVIELLDLAPLESVTLLGASPQADVRTDNQAGDQQRQGHQEHQP
jgi:hypothetical protein